MKLTNVNITPAGALVLATVTVETDSMASALAWVGGLQGTTNGVAKPPPAPAPVAVASPPKAPKPPTVATTAPPAAPAVQVALPVAPVVTAPVAAKHLVKSEYGDITVTTQSGKKTIAALGGHSCAGATEDDAIGGLLEILEGAVQKQPPPAPAAALMQDAGAPPPEVVACTSFRHVILWFLEHGHKTKEGILSLCLAWKDQVPAIARLSGDLSARVERALQVIMNEQPAPAAS